MQLIAQYNNIIFKMLYDNKPNRVAGFIYFPTPDVNTRRLSVMALDDPGRTGAFVSFSSFSASLRSLESCNNKIYYYHILGCSALKALILPCINNVTGVSNKNQRFQIIFETSDLKAGMKRVEE